MIEFIAKLLTFYIPFKKPRKFLRKRIQTLCHGWKIYFKAKKVGKGLYVGGPSKIGYNTYLSDHVCFNGMDIRGHGKVTIGRYFHSGTGCTILTENHEYDNNESIPYSSKNVWKPVEIGDFVWFGINVLVLPGTKIGEGAIIQAGSVVHGEIPPYAIAGGNPAKVFKYRDKESFEKLKAEGKFH